MKMSRVLDDEQDCHTTAVQGVVTPIGTVVTAKTGVKGYFCHWSSSQGQFLPASSYYNGVYINAQLVRFLVPQTGWQFSGGLTFTFHWSELQI